MMYINIAVLGPVIEQQRRELRGQMTLTLDLLWSNVNIKKKEITKITHKHGGKTYYF